MSGRPAASGAAHAIRSTIIRALVEVRHPGEGDLPGQMLWRLGQAVITVVLLFTNLVGALAVLAIAFFVLPLPLISHASHVRQVNLIAAAAYVAFALTVGTVIGTWRLFALREWLIEGRRATVAETRIVLQAPLRLFWLQVGLWLGGAVVFAIVDLTYSSQLALRVAIAVALTGAVTASCAYLMTERLMRPAAARALANDPPERLAVPGVATRAVLAWLLGTGLPVFGVVAIGVLALTGDVTLTHTPSSGITSLGVAMVVLGGTGIAVGLLAVVLAARTTADPIESVRSALGDVRQGDFDTRIPVYDGTQIGQLQLGFNQMVAGLAERERIRHTFGTYVDPDVAEHILEEGTDLAGEEVEVTVMFLDIRDFTAFAEQTPANDVVAALNELFDQVVPVIHDHGGRVDKFVGDGLLAVFGAPRRQSDHADQALGAACEIARRLQGEENRLRIGIGLNSGSVVAGNVGGGGRFEFSVIGDAVNVAARIEAATRSTGDVILLADRTRDLLEREHCELLEREQVELRGKTQKVRVYAPAEFAEQE